MAVDKPPQNQAISLITEIYETLINSGLPGGEHVSNVKSKRPWRGQK